MVKAELNNYRQSPRKVKLVVDLVRGKSVEQAVSLLSFANKKSGDPVIKLIKSAIANAKNQNISTENLFIKEITVNGGAIMYRRRPVSRGRAHPIKKRTSHICLILDEKIVPAKKVKKTKKVEAKVK